MTPFRLLFEPVAKTQLASLRRGNPKEHKKILKCLGLMEGDPRHSGLNSHRYESLDDVHGQKIWESYAENKTPGAYRVFWHYGPKKNEITIITIIAITPHP